MQKNRQLSKVAIAAVIAAGMFVAYAITHSDVIVTDEYWGTVQKRNIDLITENYPILNIWALKDKTYLVVDDFMEKQISEVVKIVKQKSPSNFDKNSEENLRNLLKLNMLKSYL